ncbi:MAG: NifB/NifX family molybdenum-iron cluster-binding protein [Bacteroidota bacterium]
MKKKIAVPANDNSVLDAHFGHCKFFVLAETNGEEITAEETVQPPPHEPGVLPAWLAENGVTDVLAGGMGNRAIQLFNQNGVNVFVGAPKLEARELISGFLNNSIQFSANYCDH